MKQKKPKVFKVEIYSDVVCPWCYVGKRYVESALEYYRHTYPTELQPEVVWLPYQLHAKLPPQGVDRAEYLKRRYPGQSSAQEMFGAVIKAGRQVGIEYRFDRITVQPNTTNAHRLIRFAEQRGQRAGVVEGLFSAYFVEGRNLSDNEELVSIGVANGLEREQLAAYLASDVDAEWVHEVDARAKYLGITTVPFMVLNGRKGFSANQPPDVIFEALRWARKDYARPSWWPRIL